MENNFSNIITQLRKQNGLSQKQAAEHLGISQALLSHYEKGIRECGLDFVIKASEFYAVSTDYLLGVGGSAKSDSKQSSATFTDEYYKLQNSKREILNSLQMIYSMLVKIDNYELYKDVNNILYFYIYHILRVLGTVSLEQNEEFFEIPYDKSLFTCNSLISLSYLSLVEHLDTSTMKRLARLNLQKVFSYNETALTKINPINSKSLISLINTVEKKLKTRNIE